MPVAPESGDPLLVKFRERYDGFQFARGLALLALGKSGANREFNALRQSGALVSPGLNPADSILSKIRGKVFENTLGCGYVRIGEQGHKFIGVLAGGEPAHRAKVFVDWILWLDSDMAFPPDALHRLLGRNKDMVGCNYVTRTIPTKPVAVRADRMHIRTDPDSAGLEEAEWTGFGCLLVKADIYRDLEMPWFDFVWLENSDDIMGEDVFFFKKAKHFLGKQLYIDHDLSQMVRHIGQFEYHNRLALATIEDYKARGESLEGIENAK